MARTAAKATATPKLELAFSFEKDTPGTFRFKEEDDGSGERGAIGTLYITKKAIADAGLKGKRILVTVEDAD